MFWYWQDPIFFEILGIFVPLSFAQSSAVFRFWDQGAGVTFCSVVFWPGWIVLVVEKSFQLVSMMLIEPTIPASERRLPGHLFRKDPVVSWTPP